MRCSVAKVLKTRAIASNSQNWSYSNNKMYVIFYEVIGSWGDNIKHDWSRQYQISIREHFI
jgi:hypothetical protein